MNVEYELSFVSHVNTCKISFKLNVSNRDWDIKGKVTNSSYKRPLWDFSGI